MGNFSVLIGVFSSLFDSDSNGGERITDAEVDKLRQAYQGKPEEKIIGRLAEFINSPEPDGGRLSSVEIQKLEEEYPHLAPSLIREMQTFCFWKSSVRLFAADTGKSTPNCEGKIGEALTYLKNKMKLTACEQDLFVLAAQSEGLDQALGVIHSKAFMEFVPRFQEKYPSEKGWRTDGLDLALSFFSRRGELPLLEDGFAQFVHLLRDPYKTNILTLDRDPANTALKIYRDPQLLALLKKEVAQDLFRKLDGIFGFDPESALVVWRSARIMDVLLGKKDLNGYLETIRAFHARFREAYGTEIQIRNTEQLRLFLLIADDPELSKQIFEPETLQFHKQVTQDYGIKLDMERFRQFLNFASNKRLCEFLTKNYGKLLQGQKGDKPVLVRIRHLEDFSTVNQLLSRSDAHEFFEIALQFKSSLYDMEILSDRVSDIRKLRPVLTEAARRYPRLTLETNSTEEAEEIARLTPGTGLSGEDAAALYAFLCEGQDLPAVKLSDFLRFLSNDRVNRVLSNPPLLEKYRTILSATGAESTPSRTLDLVVELDAESAEKLGGASGRKVLSRLTYGVNFKKTAQLFDRGLYDFLEALDKAGIFGAGKMFDKPAAEYLSSLNLIEMAQALQEPTIIGELQLLQRQDVFLKPHFWSLPELISQIRRPGGTQRLLKIRKIMGQPIGIAVWKSGSEEAKALNALTGFDDSFVDFCINVRAILQRNQVSIIEVSQMRDLRAKRGGQALDSESFRNILDAVRRDFHISEFTVDMVEPLLNLAQSLKWEEIESLKRQIKITPSSNDLFLLNTVVQDSELKALLLNRTALLAEAGNIYQSDPLPRGSLDRPMEGYTERPALEEIDSLSLLRLVLLKRGLGKPDVLAGLGSIVSRDLADLRTEYGGQILWRAGAIHFNSVQSLSHHNGSYHNSLNSLLDNALMEFHLHATREDGREYAGPSGGQEHAGGGDWGVARSYRSTGVVVTAAGSVKGKNDRIWVNVDMYYVDGNGRGFVIDLGLYEAPYTP